jgi:hypothetical protein
MEASACTEEVTVELLHKMEDPEGTEGDDQEDWKLTARKGLSSKQKSTKLRGGMSPRRNVWKCLCLTLPDQ